LVTFPDRNRFMANGKLDSRVSRWAMGGGFMDCLASDFGWQLCHFDRYAAFAGAQHSLAYDNWRFAKSA
jgi:hypothetical protein